MLSSPRKSTNLDKHIPAVAEADGQPVAVQDHAMPASESSHGDASQVNACETVVASGRKSPVKQTVGSNGSSASCDVQSLVSKYEEPPRQAKTKGQLKKQLRRKQELCAKAVTPIISGSDSYSSSLQVTSDTGGLSVSSQSSVSSAMDLMECKNLVVDSCHQSPLPVVPTTKSSNQRSYLIGDLLWGHVSGHPWWPCMVTYDPMTSVFSRKRTAGKKTAFNQYHVQFFGEQKERGWITPCNLIQFEGRAAFEELVRQKPSWAVSRSRLAAWETAVVDAERAVPMNRMERIQRLTFEYDSILPTYMLSRLPPTPVETPDPPKRRGGKRKAIKSDDEARSTVARCIDILDEMSPPNKRQKKSLNVNKPSPVTSPKSSCKNVSSSEKLDNYPQVVNSSPKVQKILANMERDERGGLGSRSSPRKSLKTSLVDAAVDCVNGCSDSASSDIGQHKKNVHEIANVGLAKSTPKQLSKVNDLIKEDGSRQTRSSSRIRTLNEFSNSDGVDSSVSENEVEGDINKSLSRVNGAITFGSTPEKSDRKGTNPVQKLMADDVEKDFQAAAANCGHSDLLDAELGNDSRRPSRYRSPRRLCSKEQARCENAAPKSPEKTAERRSSSRAQRKSYCNNLADAVEMNEKPLKRHRSLPGNEVEKLDFDNAHLQKAGKRHKLSGDMAQKDDSTSDSNKSSTCDKKNKKNGTRVKVRAHRKLVCGTESVENDMAYIDQQSDVPSQSSASESTDSRRAALQRHASKLDEFCSVCEQTSDVKLICCNGPCLRMFHGKCIGLINLPAYPTFMCDECTTGMHTCFVCGQPGFDTVRCTASPSCGRFYHQACAMKFPQTRFEKNRLICPLHTCATCFINADDDEDDLRREATRGRFYKCVKCPTAYHTDDLCVAAGCTQLGNHSIVCSKHFEPEPGLKGRYHSRVNVGWCFQCSKGGTLVCCDSCPAAYHAECLDISPPEGAWYCKDCIIGRRLHYGDIVWVKLGSYRWWPCQICLPQHVPDNILAMPHGVGEFPVKFFGTNEYFWTFQGRAFHFQEGDHGCRAAVSKAIDKAFNKALAEAKDAYNVWSSIQVNREKALIEKCNRKPAPYKHVKSNVPLGGVEIQRVAVGELPRCQCRPTTEQPCGPDSDCINRYMLYECHPSVCPNGDQCMNQRFQRRQYPPVKSFRTEKRGWGLMACADIQKGQFVCEYVGDLIDEAECKRRLEAARSKNMTNFYMLTLDKNRIIDAGPKGNLSRFMNHSCQPNCETQKWNVNGDVRVGLFAIVDIPAGTELTFNYRLDCYGNDKTVCQCGTPVCSGFIGVRPKTANSVDADQKAEKRRKKKKNRKAAAAVVEDQANAGTPTDNKAHHRNRSRGRRQTVCLVCNQPAIEGAADVIECDYRRICGKPYHLKCVQLDAPPHDRWNCPRHTCNLCDRHAVALCAVCTTSYCRNHFVGNIVDSTAPEVYSKADISSLSLKRVFCLAHGNGAAVDCATVANEDVKPQAVATNVIKLEDVDRDADLPVVSNNNALLMDDDKDAIEKIAVNEEGVVRRGRKSCDGQQAKNNGSQQQRLSYGTRKRGKKDAGTEENCVETLAGKHRVTGLDIAEDLTAENSIGVLPPSDGHATKLRSNRRRSHLASLNDDLSVDRHTPSELKADGLSLSAPATEVSTATDTNLNCIDKVSLVITSSPS